MVRVSTAKIAIFVAPLFFIFLPLSPRTSWWLQADD
jgi:hypothetical protein